MDLQINNQLFIVCGATSGFGRAIAQLLLQENTIIIAIARGENELQKLKNEHQNNVEIIVGDITKSETIEALIKQIDKRQLHGIVVNAGGPPAKTVLETSLNDWDDAYKNILRWKVEIAQKLMPIMIEHNYGRMVFIESSSVKQPIENLVLSTSLRLAVVGMVKTLSQEVAKHGITLNILAPGSHNTPAIDRLYNKKVEQTGLSFDIVKQTAIAQIPMSKLGEANDFAGLALWLLSPQSRFVTGQTFSVDGGVVKGTF